MIGCVDESAQCAVGEEKRETAKELLERMCVILDELNNEVRMIADAVYRGANCNQVEGVPKEPKPPLPPLIVIMKKQRDEAGGALRELVKIREALW